MRRRCGLAGLTVVVAADRAPRRYARGLSRPIVLGIGLSKTGTTSLNSALEVLGWDARHNPTDLLRLDGGRLSIDVEAARRREALTDLPVARFFRELDEAIPGARFVVTTRSLDSWLPSAKNHFYAPSPHAAECELIRQVYGAEAFDAERFAEGYRRHYAAVERHFADRPRDALVLDVRDSDKWERLCAFLGEPVPDVPYPASNPASSAPDWLKRLVRANPTILRAARRARDGYRSRTTGRR